MADTLTICLVSPYALAGSHPVAEYVRNEATGLAGRGHRVTVLAPSSSTRSLRSGRERLRALAGGDREAVHALAGEPLAIAVGPAVPHRSRGRGRGAGIPVAASANVALAVGEGVFDIVHAHDPTVPGLATAALRHTRGLTVATFHAETERALAYPLRGGSRKRFGARIDALVASSPQAAELAATLYPGDYRIEPDPIAPAFAPGEKAGRLVVAEWTGEARQTVRALLRMVADAPGTELILAWDRRGRRPMRPYIPPGARGRVRIEGMENEEARARLLGDVDVFVGAPEGSSRLAWEARAAGAVVVSPGDGPGLRYAPDQPPLAAAAAVRALEDDELRARLSAEGREAAAGRSAGALAERLEGLYDALRRRRRARASVAPARRPLIDVDLHMHTSHSHDCATDPEALVDHCIEQGLGAIAITDHNEISGAVEAAALGKPITVIVGEEVKTSQGEVIGLFLTERIEKGMPMAETIAAIQAQGGLVLMPHPFDRLHTIPDSATLLRHLDEIDVFEVYNSRLLFDSFNDDALRFATKYNLVQSAGSDAHVLPGIGTAINRIPAFDGPEEFLVAMRHNEIVRRPKNLLYLQGLKWVQQVGKTGS
ncbi:MAG TPA: glycosyltransferase [Gaiellales bacterium]|jgi:predicted metal-dependent phosphoesterase TrpH/glycosyltransferase involved in cell wall biosynthesis|nr:glycosyltransferase [Gaiellales bacterium]